MPPRGHLTVERDRTNPTEASRRAVETMTAADTPSHVSSYRGTRRRPPLHDYTLAHNNIADRVRCHSPLSSLTVKSNLDVPPPSPLPPRPMPSDHPDPSVHTHAQQPIVKPKGPITMRSFRNLFKHPDPVHVSLKSRVREIYNDTGLAIKQNNRGTATFDQKSKKSVAAAIEQVLPSNHWFG